MAKHNKHKGGKHSIRVDNVPGNHKGNEGGHPTHHAMNKAHGTPMGFHAEEEYGGMEQDKGLDHGATHHHSITEQAYGAPGKHGTYKGSEGQGVPSMEGNEECD